MFKRKIKKEGLEEAEKLGYITHEEKVRIMAQRASDELEEILESKKKKKK